MAKTPTPTTPQQGSTPAPNQQQGQHDTTVPQAGQPLIRDWASI